MDLIDILNRFSVPYRLSDHHHVSSGWVGVDCPRCSPGWSRFRLGFEISTGRCNCWVCGSRKNLEALAEVCKISVGEAARIWKGVSSAVVAPAEHLGILKLPVGRKPLAESSPHWTYMIRRGFHPFGIVQLWGVEAIGLAAHLQWRLFIPIHDGTGQIVSWTTRSIAPGSSRRYISASSDEETIQHKTILYGAHLARQSIIIVEGPLDAWSIGPGAVATCGVGFTQIQLAEMTQYPVRSVCFDATDEAQGRAEQLCNHLAAFPGSTENILLETGDDPADADPLEIDEIRSKYLQGFL